ncbi:hypothetical protein B0H11DRAFT_1901842 [Mycena galericulata]|nr:hypothetical protein B0H11DRAFT_1901842 [Mycena galericulata]
MVRQEWDLKPLYYNNVIMTGTWPHIIGATLNLGIQAIRQSTPLGIEHFRRKFGVVENLPSDIVPKSLTPSWPSYGPKLVRSERKALMGFTPSSKKILSPIVVSATAIGYLYNKRPVSDIKIHELGGIPLLNAWSFFTDSVCDTILRTDEKLFQFRVCKHRVVASSGEDARKIFFNDKSMNLDEGYKILLGSGPDLADIQRGDAGHRESIHGSLQATEATVGMVTCSELAHDPEAVARLWTSTRSSKRRPPPQPSCSQLYPEGARENDGRALVMLQPYVELRRNTPVPSRDAIDVLLAEGTPTEAIVVFVLGSVFADVVNSGIKTLHLYVTYSAAYYGDDDKSAGPSSTWAWILRGRRVPPPESAVPRHARQPRLPIRPTAHAPRVNPHALIRETLRLAMGGVALRRNVGPAGIAPRPGASQPVVEPASARRDEGREARGEGRAGALLAWLRARSRAASNSNRRRCKKRA